MKAALPLIPALALPFLVGCGEERRTREENFPHPVDVNTYRQAAALRSTPPTNLAQALAAPPLLPTNTIFRGTGIAETEIFTTNPTNTLVSSEISPVRREVVVGNYGGDQLLRIPDDENTVPWTINLKDPELRLLTTFGFTPEDGMTGSLGAPRILVFQNAKGRLVVVETPRLIANEDGLPVENERLKIIKCEPERSSPTNWLITIRDTGRNGNVTGLKLPRIPPKP